MLPSTVIRISAALLSFATAFTARGQQPPQELNPVVWAIAAPPTSARVGDTVALTLTATIDAGWHVYALTQIEDGPFALRVRVLGDSPVTSAGTPTGPAPERQATSAFGIPVEWYSGRVRFAVPLRIAQSPNGTTPSNALARLAVRYQACSASLCLPPRTIEVQRRLAVRTR